MTTRQSRLLRNIILAAAAFCAGMACRGCGGRERGADGDGAERVETLRDTVWLTDTINVPVPVPGAERVVRDTVIVAAVVPTDSLADADPGPGPDSAVVSLPVVSRHYGDSLYDAWVSGPVDPRLDSLRVYPQRMEITETVTIARRPSRWGVSFGVGVVAGPGGVEPGVFFGLAYILKPF